jgi:hypothetical protein
MRNSYRTILILIFNAAFSIHNCFSQTAPGIEWQNTIGGSSADWTDYVEQTSDGGYIVGGYSYSNISGDKTENCLGSEDYWVVKLNSAGNIMWQNTIGGSGYEQLFCIHQTTDGGYILGGHSASNISGDKTENSNGDTDYWIVKIDNIGNIEWQNTIGGSGSEYLFDIVETTDGGFFLGGISSSNISGDKTENCIGNGDYWVVKTDHLGNVMWDNTIGGTDFDECRSVRQTSDGGFILGGISQSNISGDKTENSMGDIDYWIVKLDSLGNIKWQNTIGGSDEDFFRCLQIDGEGYILGGGSASNISGDKTENSQGSWDYWIVKIDSLGNILWQNTIGGSGGEDLSYVQITNDGGYILEGISDSGISGDKTEVACPVINGGGDNWVLKLDANGIIQWQKVIGGNDTEYEGSIQPTTDHGYILCCHSMSDSSCDKTENCIGGPDFWVIKLGPDTITGITQLPQLPNYPITISPNPLTTRSKLTFKNPNKEKFLFTLFDITGRVTESVSTIANEIILIKGSKPAGVYLFNLVNEKTGDRSRGKIVVAE